MVKIVVAGGSGQVAREVIDALLNTKKHEITVFSRGVSFRDSPTCGVHYHQVDYNDKYGLSEALRGVHTVLSFIQVLSDPDQQSQKNLIDACVTAGVKRFAPSEYGSAGTVNMPWWTGKEEIRQYLSKLNEEGKLLEYTLFQPGLFLDYLASPYQTAKYVTPLDTVFDFQKRRAILVEGHEDALMTFTSVADFSAMVAAAVEYKAEWPVVSGICGNRVTVSQVVQLAEAIRGPITVDKVKATDLEAGKLSASWTVAKKHTAVANEDASALFKTVTVGMLLSSIKRAWEVSDELNKLFPDYRFQEIKTFLTHIWANKP